MTNEELKKLNGEHLLHTVWIATNDQVMGICDRTIEDVRDMLTSDKYNVVRIDCVGVTSEHKVREIERWGD